MSPVLKIVRAVSSTSGFCRITAGLLFAGVSVPLLSAQTSAAPGGDEVVHLSTFEVTGAQPNRYEASDVSSGGRVRTNIFDSAQTINVVTDQLIKDVGAVRILDALKYVPGVTESTIPDGLDRITVRGFQVDGATVDGFYDITQANIDPVTIDRIEVVKGPNAILSPTGSPGGTINSVTKKPLFVAPTTTFQVQYGVFDSGGVQLDSTGRIGDASSKFAYRVVADIQHYDSYYGNTRTKSHTIAPSLAYQFNPATKLVVQAEFSSWKAGAYLGIPIDPSTGPNNQAHLLAGVSDTASVYADDMYRYDQRSTYKLFFTSDLNDHLSVRVAARLAHYTLDNQGLNFSPNNGNGGAINPLTGVWVPGTVFGPGPTYTPAPAPVQSRIFNRGGQRSTVTDKKQNFQNDWVYQFSIQDVKSVTGAGFAYTRRLPDGAQGTINSNLTDTPLDFSNIFLTPATNTGVVNTDENNFELTRQYYLNQSIATFGDRLIFSGGISRLSAANQTIRLLPNGVNVLIHSAKTTHNYGLVLKPVKDVSLFYGHSENASPVSTNLSPPGTPDFSEGSQNELGGRVHLIDDRFQAAVTYFKIKQNAFSVPNPANLTVPAPVPPAPLLFSDRLAKGWEYELTYEIVKGLTVIGNYTSFTNRDPHNVPFRGTAEKSGAVWMRYEFLNGDLKGFNASVGTTYLAKRPGDSAFGLTGASTPTNLIPNQPTFYLPALNLAYLAFGYNQGSWSYQANVDNVFNTHYLAASISRNAVFAGPRINLRASIAYKF
jgi:iron complex outermembrane receptor protein